jgi:hypothetical protein
MTNEHDVGMSGKTSLMNPKSETHPMKDAADAELEARVLAADVAHDLRAFGSRVDVRHRLTFVGLGPTDSENLLRRRIETFRVSLHLERLRFDVDAVAGNVPVRDGNPFLALPFVERVAADARERKDLLHGVEFFSRGHSGG